MTINPLNQKFEKDSSIIVLKVDAVIKSADPYQYEKYHGLFLLTDGSGKLAIDDKLNEIYPPVGFYLKPGQKHNFDYFKMPLGYVILFKQDFLSQYSWLPVNLSDLAPQFDMNRDPSLKEIISLLYQDFRINAREDILASWLNLILLKTRRISQ